MLYAQDRDTRCDNQAAVRARGRAVEPEGENTRSYLQATVVVDKPLPIGAFLVDSDDEPDWTSSSLVLDTVI